MFVCISAPVCMQIPFSGEQRVGRPNRGTIFFGIRLFFDLTRETDVAYTLMRFPGKKRTANRLLLL